MILNLISFGLACFSLGFSIGSKDSKYIDEKKQDDKKEQDNEGYNFKFDTKRI